MGKERRRQGKSRAQKDAEHLQLLQELELADSCCSVCHCDCYSSHSSSNGQPEEELQQLEQEIKVLEQLQEREEQQRPKSRSRSRNRSALKSPASKQTVAPRRSSVECQCPPDSSAKSRRSKSAGSEGRLRVQREGKQEVQAKLPTKTRANRGPQRDCQMLQSVYGALSASNVSGLAICGRGKSKSQEHLALVPLHQAQAQQQSLNTLSASMANLCLSSKEVRAAYERVPSHDQKILNRMVVKRNQQALDKEHAWLARKYWENERLERELLKCEQLEEYKRAIHDKQFQDYLVTKARLQALAQRDLAQLQQLRGALDEKDSKLKDRLKAMRMERELTLCQRRCEESRRSEAVILQQEEQQLDATIRKRDICMRLTQRLQRANELRNQLLSSYLQRLQHQNNLQQLQHEEHWRERQSLERLKLEQLRSDIQRKGKQSQRFVECRQRHHEARFRTAKISASLRELVRQSVTPETGLDQQAIGFYSQL
ncbi:CG17994 [Drosophila busckii]|uniref:CG17994 n=1 Tax=Drosophila busckii TaxID=30019 RepID=A0A0M4EEV5_DROBS|nr:trichohyalin [Drosophila busckii]ALC42677.1 CG17994 [Drosophila busckii]